MHIRSSGCYISPLTDATGSRVILLHYALQTQFVAIPSVAYLTEGRIRDALFPLECRMQLQLFPATFQLHQGIAQQDHLFRLDAVLIEAAILLGANGKPQQTFGKVHMAS